MESLNKDWILIPQNLSKTHIKGVLIIKSHEFEVQILLNSSHDIKKASFNCDWELKNLLAGYEAILEERLKQAEDIDGFMGEIHSIASKLLKIRDRRSGKQCCTLTVSRYSAIIEEIEKIGWEKLLHLDPGFEVISLSAKDKALREHILHLKFGSEDGAKHPTCQTDLPVPFQPSLINKDGHICSAYKQFVEVLNKHQDLWDMLCEIDENCWVLEPEARLWACCFRRIAIGIKASLLVTLNPMQPRALPICRFLGADQVISPLREKWNTGLICWDPEKTVLDNIKNILEIELPSPVSENKEDFSMDCSICYAYRLGEEIPEVSCDDARCGQLFHNTCLIEWIRSLPNFRQSFNVLFGECPYCSTPLTVKMCRKPK